MKTKAFLAGLLVFVLAIGVAYATDQSFNIQCVILSPISITKNTDLDFGTHDNTGSTVTVTPSASSPVGTAASFDVSGANGYGYTASVVESSVTLSDGSGNTMTVNNFTVDDGTSATPGATFTGTFGASAVTLYAGGDLTIASGQTTGTYSGSATFRVVYN